MDPQQYCLRWSNHQNNLQSVFLDLLASEAFVDVTLACDGKHLKAHKMVLSACSPYFQTLLFHTQDTHPIVFLKDVQLCEMKAILDFMYKGEMSVDQENLDSLLKVAENLQIKGLAEISLEATRKTQLAEIHPDFRLCPFNVFDSGQHAFGSKRKRGRPRRLSGCESMVKTAEFKDGNYNYQEQVSKTHTKV